MFSTDVKVDLYPVVEQMKSEELLRVRFTAHFSRKNGKTDVFENIEGEDQYGNKKAVSVTLKTLMHAYLRPDEFSPREDCDTAVVEIRQSVENLKNSNYKKKEINGSSRF